MLRKPFILMSLGSDYKQTVVYLYEFSYVRLNRDYKQKYYIKLKCLNIVMYYKTLQSSTVTPTSSGEVYLYASTYPKSKKPKEQQNLCTYNSKNSCKVYNISHTLSHNAYTQTHHAHILTLGCDETMSLILSPSPP